MKGLINTAGTIAGFLGLIVCLAAVVGRFYGEKLVLEFQAINVFIVGLGLIICACWAKLEAASRA